MNNDQSFEEFKKQVIKDNPLNKKCSVCGYEDKIYGATVRPGDGEDEYEWCVLYGSDADFCTKCGEPW